VAVKWLASEILRALRALPHDRAARIAAGIVGAVIAAMALFSSCAGCIGIVEWGDTGDGVPVSFAVPAEVAP